MSLTLDSMVTTKGVAFLYPDNGEPAGSVIQSPDRKFNAEPIWGSARPFRSKEAAGMYVTAMAIEARLAKNVGRR